MTDRSLQVCIEYHLPLVHFAPLPALHWQSLVLRSRPVFVLGAGNSVPLREPYDTEMGEPRYHPIEPQCRHSQHVEVKHWGTLAQDGHWAAWACWRGYCLAVRFFRIYEAALIAAHDLPEGNARDTVQAAAFLRQAQVSVASVIADGAYNSEPVYRMFAAWQHDPPSEAVVPSRASATRT